MKQVAINLWVKLKEYLHYKGRKVQNKLDIFLPCVARKNEQIKPESKQKARNHQNRSRNQ